MGIQPSPTKFAQRRMLKERPRALHFLRRGRAAEDSTVCHCDAMGIRVGLHLDSFRQCPRYRQDFQRVQQSQSLRCRGALFPPRATERAIRLIKRRQEGIAMVPPGKDVDTTAMVIMFPNLARAGVGPRGT
jgi:hypothetical protein